MGQQMTERHRVTISAEVDPELLEAVDAIAAKHSDLDRNAVIDEALRLWWDHEVAMTEQFAPPTTPEQQEDEAERAAWRSIQAAAAERVFRSR